MHITCEILIPGAKLGFLPTDARRHACEMKKYRSLVAWQSAHAFVISTFKATDRCLNMRTLAVFDQLRRGALSIELNIVEGYALETPAQFRRHLRIAKASAAECERLVDIVRELKYLDERVVDNLERQVDLALRTIIGLLRRGGPPQ